MTSKSDLVVSMDDSPFYSISHRDGEISTSNGERTVKPLSTKSKCAIVAFVIGSVAGIVIIGLGTMTMFGPKGSTGFIGSLAGGGVLTVASGGGLIWIAISNCKNSQEKPIVLNRGDTAIIEYNDDTHVGRSDKKEKPVASGEVRNEKVYPEIGKAAINFARQKLSEHPEIKPTVFSAGWHGPLKTNQPVNQEIAQLTTLYWDVYFAAFEQEVKKHAEPWSQLTVIQAADDLMKIGYAISCLTLEDLPAFIDSLASKRITRTYAQALTIQDSYQYRTYFYCTKTYHWIRGGVAWIQNPLDDEEEGLFQPETISKEHAEAFYNRGLMQSDWRMLYNDYCDRVRLYVKEDELKRADNRHFTWTKKDEGETTFRQTPDRLPT